MILGRWLSETVKVILLDEPTRGIDIGAKSEIYTIMQNLAREGVCVIMVSSELPEVLGVADRIAVMRQGRIAAIVDRGNATKKNSSNSPCRWKRPRRHDSGDASHGYDTTRLRSKKAVRLAANSRTQTPRHFTGGRRDSRGMFGFHLSCLSGLLCKVWGQSRYDKHVGRYVSKP